MAKRKNDDKTPVALIAFLGLAGLGGILLATSARGEQIRTPTYLNIASELVESPLGDFVRITITLTA